MDATLTPTAATGSATLALGGLMGGGHGGFAAGAKEPTAGPLAEVRQP